MPRLWQRDNCTKRGLGNPSDGLAHATTLNGSVESFNPNEVITSEGNYIFDQFLKVVNENVPVYRTIPTLPNSILLTHSTGIQGKG